MSSFFSHGSTLRKIYLFHFTKYFGSIKTLSAYCSPKRGISSPSSSHSKLSALCPAIAISNIPYFPSFIIIQTFLLDPINLYITTMNDFVLRVTIFKIFSAQFLFGLLIVVSCDTVHI